MSPENAIQDRYDAADDAERHEQWAQLIELARLYGKKPGESWQMFFHNLHRNDNALDMFRDEFMRIQALCLSYRNEGVFCEIKHLCDRAISGIESRVPLIKQVAEARASAIAQRELAATHRCKVCGALWICFSDSWSLASQKCGPCCDNQPMAAQIEAVGMTKELDERWGRLFEKSDKEADKWYRLAMAFKGALVEWQRVYKETECEHDDCQPAWENADRILSTMDPAKDQPTP